MHKIVCSGQLPTEGGWELLPGAYSFVTRLADGSNHVRGILIAPDFTSSIQTGPDSTTAVFGNLIHGEISPERPTLRVWKVPELPETGLGFETYSELVLSKGELVWEGNGHTFDEAAPSRRKIRPHGETFFDVHLRPGPHVFMAEGRNGRWGVPFRLNGPTGVNVQWLALQKLEFGTRFTTEQDE